MSMRTISVTNRVLLALITWGEQTYNLKIRFKDETWHQKLLAKLAFFNPEYMNFTTTIGNTVYFPTRSSFENQPTLWTEVLAHELRHLHDSAAYPVVFQVSYLLPQLMAVLAVPFLIMGITMGPWWLLGLAFVLCLAPLPAPWRKKWEMAGYTTSMAVLYWESNWNPTSLPGYFVKNFTSSSYYFMWPFGKNVKSELEWAMTQITSGDILSDPFYAKLKTIVSKQ